MRVLITDHRFPNVDLEIGILQAAGIEVRVAQCRTTADVIRESEGCQALLIVFAPVDASVFAARPEIALCARMGVGYDTINLADAKAAGVWVTNSPDYGSSEVAIHALTMALALLRHIPQYDRDVRRGTWSPHSTGPTKRLANLTVGVLGYGRIGSRFAYFAQTMFGRVLAHDPIKIDGDFAPYVEGVSLERLLAESDVISMHTLLNDQTRHLMNGARLDAMKPGSILVNTSRGGVIDIAALEARLDKFDGIGLDVLPIEPIPADSKLLTAPNTLISPHSAYYTEEAQRDLRTRAVSNIVQWQATGRPVYVVVEGSRMLARG